MKVTIEIECQTSFELLAFIDITKGELQKRLKPYPGYHIVGLDGKTFEFKTPVGTGSVKILLT